MWKQIFAFIQMLFTLARDVERDRAEILKLRQDLFDLTLEVTRLSNEHLLTREHESGEREKMALRLENLLLKFEQRLSPPNDVNKVGHKELS